jgi:predicted AAA+ superfamily ATPase
MPEIKLIDRPEYMAKLERHRATPDRIKIVTGVRRCGKSTLFKLFQDKLRSEGIKDEQILPINLEDFANRSLLDGRALHDYIEAHAAKDKLTYVFIDEVQLVQDYADVITSLRMRNNIDLYVTGSNNSLLPTKLPKKLGGRYQQIHMFPLSFKEYVSAYRPIIETSPNRWETQFQDYITYGSFPETLAYWDPKIPSAFDPAKESLENNRGWDVQGAREYLASTYDSILVRDIMTHDGIRELPQLTRVINFMFSNIGNATSVNKMMAMINDEFKTSPKNKMLYAPMLEKYLEALLDCFLFYKADIQRSGRELLRTNAKYYAVDVSLRQLLIGGAPTRDAGHILENIVYLELLRRGYEVRVGKIGDKEKEIDFIAQTSDGRIEYYQVAQSVIDETTLARELASLESVKDNYPKFLLTRDVARNDYNGIQHINVLEWLVA